MANYRGMSLLAARRAWLRMGGTVETRTGTGEDVYRHPGMGAKGVVVNLRRTDAPRVLTMWLRRLAK